MELPGPRGGARSSSRVCRHGHYGRKVLEDSQHLFKRELITVHSDSHTSHCVLCHKQPWLPAAAMCLQQQAAPSASPRGSCSPATSSAPAPRNAPCAAQWCSRLRQLGSCAQSTRRSQ